MKSDRRGGVDAGSERCGVVRQAAKAGDTMVTTSMRSGRSRRPSEARLGERLEEQELGGHVVDTDCRPITDLARHVLCLVDRLPCADVVGA